MGVLIPISGLDDRILLTNAHVELNKGQKAIELGELDLIALGRLYVCQKGPICAILCHFVPLTAKVTEGDGSVAERAGSRECLPSGGHGYRSHS